VYINLEERIAAFFPRNSIICDIYPQNSHLEEKRRLFFPPDMESSGISLTRLEK